MSNYPCVQVLEVINVLSYKLLYLLQIILICSILQQIDNFLRKQPSWINLEYQITPVYQVWWLQMNNFRKSSIFGLFQPHIWKNCCCSSSSSSNKKFLTPWSWSSYLMRKSQWVSEKNLKWFSSYYRKTVGGGIKCPPRNY